MHSYIYYYPKFDSSNELKWRMKIEKLPEAGSYFFALHFHINQEYLGNHIAGYAGLQLVNSTKKAIFSLWYSSYAKASNGFEANDINEDGPVKRIMGPYDWEINKLYSLCLKFNKNNITFNIKDEEDNLKNVGMQMLPNNFSYRDLAPKIDLFTEWFGGDGPTIPIKVIFSDFYPFPKKLEVAKNDNTLGCNMGVSNNSATFELVNKL